jgi:hypothetical protein
MEWTVTDMLEETRRFLGEGQQRITFRARETTAALFTREQRGEETGEKKAEEDRNWNDRHGVECPTCTIGHPGPAGCAFFARNSASLADFFRCPSDSAISPWAIRRRGDRTTGGRDGGRNLLLQPRIRGNRVK